MVNKQHSLIKLKDVIIFKDEHYNTFPNALKTSSGEIMVAFRRAPDRTRLFSKTFHIEPSSKAVFVTSKDNGNTWSEQVSVLYDDFYYGLQDPCINRLRDGTIFCSFFTWEVLTKEHAEKIPHPLDRMLAERWKARPAGIYTIRSEDEGRTWDEPILMDTGDICIRGNSIELEDGSIIMPTYAHPDDRGGARVVKTLDRGKTWTTLSTIASKEGYLHQEPNLFKTKSGKIVAFVRTVKLNEQIPDHLKHPLVTCESHDNGKTWINYQEHEVYSPSPFHILQLESGNVLVSYGYRLEPYGIRALLLDGECTNIGDVAEVVLRDDGLGFDIGYTSAVQMDDGNILITYYYYDENDGLRYIAGTLCRET